MTTPIPTPQPVPTAAAGSSEAQLNALLQSSGTGVQVGTATSSKNPLIPSRTQGHYPSIEHGAGEFSDARDAYYAADSTGGALTMRPLNDVKLDALRMSDAQLAHLAAKLQSAGLLPVGKTPTREAIEAAWDDLVDKTAKRRQANPDSKLTPYDMIDLYGGQAALDGQNNPTTTSVITTQNQLSTPDQARGMLQQMMTSALGRAPTGREADDFQAALNDAQRANPMISTTVTNTDASGNSKTTQKAPTGGLDANAFANSYQTDKVQQSAEYAHYQAATTYYNQLLQTIHGVAPAGF